MHILHLWRLHISHCNFVTISVHDGWGIAPEKGMKGDAIDAGNTTNMDTISKEHSVRSLAAHGLAVGLSDGLMGNSEVGYVFTIAVDLRSCSS